LLSKSSAIPVGLNGIRFAVLFFWLVAPLSAAGQALPDAFVVRTLTFQGVDRVSFQALRKTLAARPRPFWRWWESENPLAPMDLEDDVERIRQFYRANGYYHAKVEFEAEKTGAEASKIYGETRGPLPVLRVRFRVEEGPPVIISEVNVAVADNDAPEAAMQDISPLNAGQVFTEHDYRAAKRAIEQFYGSRGYPFAKVDGRVRVDVGENRAQVELSVEPGGLYRFGSVAIRQEGAYVDEEVVRRALAFAAGDVYSASAVEQSRRNLVNLDVFKSALVLRGEPGPDSGVLPMEVRLRAKDPRQIGFGVGYGSEDGIRLRASWAYRNAFSRAGRFTVSARRTDLVQNVQAEYAQPYWPDARTDLRSRTGWERETFDSYTNQKRFLDAAFDRRLWPDWTGTIGYGLEDNELEEVEIDDPEERAEFILNNEYLISSINAGIGYKQVDNELYPTTGEVFVLSSDQAFNALGSELSFVNPSVELKVYRTPVPPMTLAARLKLESIEGIEDTDFIPVFKRLFLGGSNTVRGYGYRMLGPLDDNGLPLGGKTAVNANLEGRFPLFRSFSGIVFIDAGAVDPDSFQFDAGEIRIACGAGFRYDSVIGPLRVEVGYKLNPVEEDELPEGVEAEERWRIHFSIGQTF